MACTTVHCSKRVGYRATRVVVAMDTNDDVIANVSLHCANDVLHFKWQRATICVAQHQVRCAIDDRRLKRAQGKFWVALVTVEEMFHINKYLSTSTMQELHRVANHGQALVERCLQCLLDVIVR